jgi:hypothetical protein
VPQPATLLLAPLISVGFDIFTALIVTTAIFWDVTPYIPVKVHESSGGKLPP